jgi:hypothetical protein
MYKTNILSSTKKDNQYCNKMNAECFTKCTVWKLNTTMVDKKSSTGLVNKFFIFLHFLNFRMKFLFKNIF